MASVRPNLPLPLPIQGIRADLDDFHVPPDALRVGSFNWIWRDGKIVTRPGLTIFGEIPAGGKPPQQFIFYRDDNDERISVYATIKGWWRFDYDECTWVDISNPAIPIENTLSDKSHFRVLSHSGSTFLLGVNATDLPVAWETPPTSNLFALFGGSAPAARYIAILADRVLLAGLPTGLSQVDVSAFQDHSSGWGVTQTATLIESPGLIVGMHEIGSNQVAIYKETSVYLASGTTGIAPIRFDLHTTDIPGPANSNCIIPLTRSIHAIFTQGGEMYTFDGINYAQHPATAKVRLLYEENRDTAINLTRRSHGFYNRHDNEIWFFYSRTGLESTGPQDAIVINLTNNSVWKIDFTKSGKSFTASYYEEIKDQSGILRPKILLGEHSGQWYLLEGNNDDGTAIETQMHTGLSSIGDPTQAKTLEETEFYFQRPLSNQSFTVQITSSNAGETIASSAAQTVNLTTTSSGAYSSGVRTTASDRLTSRFFGVSVVASALTAPLTYIGTTLTPAQRGFR